MSRTNAFLSWYRQKSLGTKSALQAIASVAMFYGGIFLEGRVQQSFEKDSVDLLILRLAVLGGLLVILGSASGVSAK
jgi:hypothetical protein